MDFNTTLLMDIRLTVHGAVPGLPVHVPVHVNRLAVVPAQRKVVQKNHEQQANNITAFLN